MGQKINGQIAKKFSCNAKTFVGIWLVIRSTPAAISITKTIDKEVIFRNVLWDKIKFRRNNNYPLLGFSISLRIELHLMKIHLTELSLDSRILCTHLLHYQKGR